MELLGRGPEQATIGALLDEGANAGGALVVCGSPGVGKSALLEWAASRAADRFLIVRAAGSLTEFGLPYAALHQLLRPLFEHLPELAPHHRAVLEAAFEGATDMTTDLYAVSMAALELLAEAATEKPVLALLDDAQWMDPASQSALAFVARRVATDRVVLLATQRDAEPGALLDPGIPALLLGPLDAQSAELVLEIAGASFDARTRSTLLQAARGNPLALLELPRVQRDGSFGDPDLIPLTARLEESFLARMEEFEPRTKRTLEVAATCDSDDLAEITAATELLVGGPVTRALDPAVAAGLLLFDGSTLRFRHPLIRSAILQRLGPDNRRRCHAALAEVLQQRPERALWHRAAATLQPDSLLAAELEATADRAVERGAPANAVRALDRAAQLSTDSAEKRTRTYRAATLCFATGELESGERLRMAYRELIESEHDRLRYEWLTELAGSEREGEHRVTGLLDLARRAAAVGDNELAMDFLRVSAQRCWNYYPGLALGRQVIAVSDELGVCDVPTQAEVLAYGAPFDADQTVRTLVDRVLAESRNATVIHRVGHAAACAGAFDISERLLLEAAEGLRSEGRLPLLGRTLSLLSWTSLRRGHWSASVAAAEEGARLCSESAQPFWQASALVAQSAVAAFRGDFPAAEELVAAAEGMDSHEFAAASAISLVARAAIAAGRNQPELSLSCLTQLHDVSHPAYHPAHGLWSLASLAEAASLCGEVPAARRLIAALRPEVRNSTSGTGQMNLSIAAAILAPDDEAERLFLAALDIEMTTWPFERYRLLFSYGRWLRRQRRLPEAQQFLRTARDGLDRLGAKPFAERARSELRASGERSHTSAADTWDLLSPQEVQIATMVAKGLTNKDIAKRLFISHRTVGNHLYRIFPKLDITTRGELQLFAAERAVSD
jgi:DNA-binding CsgD family transcriptional regulator